MAMYDNPNTVEKSFDLNYISEHMIQAQWAEFIELKKIITELFVKRNAPISIFDIGMGNARIAKHLSGVKEMWAMVDHYDGTDNAQACIDIANETTKALSINDKVSTHLLEATELSSWHKKYDLVICTWFTPGNFYPDGFNFSNYDSINTPLDLSTNKKFDTVFTQAYKLVKPGGKLLLGACYHDNDATRLKQEASYRKMGMTIITKPTDRFTATKEGFWSQRFTKEKLYNYLHFARPENINMVELDTYQYAFQVSIVK